MSKLYLYNYNNYFNRIVKKESTLANYGTPIYTLAATNFNYNDGVETSHDVNYSGFDGDYLIITDEEDNIVSRWFVVENKRTRGGQHRLSLRRDLIVDNYDKIINAPCLINRAMITDSSNPLLFNPEGFSFNQIKQYEHLLQQNNCKMNYYVLYLAKNAPTKTKSLIIKPEEYDIKISTPIAQSIYAAGTHFKLINPSISVWWLEDMHWYTDTVAKRNQVRITRVRSNTEVTTQYPVTVEYVDDILWIVEENITATIENALKNKYNDIITALKTERNITETNLTEEQLNNIINANGKVIYDSTGQKYRVNVITDESSGFSFTSPEDSTLSSLIEGYISEVAEVWGDFGDEAVMGHYAYKTVDVALTPIPSTSETITWSIDFTNKVSTKAPYNVLIIPANEGKMEVRVENIQPDESIIYTYETRNIDTDTNTKILNSIIEEYGTQFIYDIQLSPYCDFGDRYNINEEKMILSNTDETEFNEQFTIVDLASKNIGWYIHYVKDISFTFDISFDNWDFDTFNTNLKTALERKVINETELYRIVSPNFNGIFEFSPMKNGGFDVINVDVTLRPYNIYIHLNPNFKNLYGSDFDDARGLVCQGDFSIPLVTDQFKTYEVNNKNYQNIFNRQIEHLDFEYGIQRTEALFGATMGAIGGSMSGAVGGSVVGGPVGAGVGATVGGIASAIGGAIDYNILKARQAENKDLMIDNFNYQLGNIKALPFTINKITPFTKNNKIWPILEIYRSTEREKLLLQNYIYYKSMTINAVGSIVEYLQSQKTYVSGSLIRLEELNMPTHEANEIYNEILKGVYI